MNRQTLFVGALIFALLSLVLAIYYALPGVYHVLVSGSHPPLSPQPTPIALFAVLTVLGAITALVNRPGAHRRSWCNKESEVKVKRNNRNNKGV